MRLKILQIIYFFAIFAVLIRLWQWQVLASDDLLAKAEKQRLSTINVQAPRGDILFSDKSTLASTQPVFLIYALPKVIKNKKAFSDTLASRLWEIETQDASFDIDYSEVIAKKEEISNKILTQLSKDLFWVSLGKIVDTQDKRRLESLNLKGIGFEATSDRFYPEGSSSAHLLGFVGSDVYGNPKGYFGLEGFYDGELRGRDGLLRQERDAMGLPILIGDYVLRKPVQGNTLVLNIDRTIQYIVEERLKAGMEKYGAKGVSAVAIDPKTGNILAMASFPSYAPAIPSQEYSQFFKNPLIADSYEPGSTFKVLVMASAINEKKVKPDTKCDICSGPLSIGGFTIRTWNNKYNPDSTMTDVIVHSDNTGMVFAAKRLGVKNLYNYIEKFGFGSPTGVDLQDEESPALRDLNDWGEIDLATASFGQGIAVTGMQMVKAVSAIANGGKVMEPHMVKEIITQKEGDKQVFEIKPKIITTPISENTAKVITEMMVQAVDKGESQYYKKAVGVQNYKIAGKTGTAQIPVAGHYDPNKTIASFIGFAPADDPKFVILVRYLEPSSSVFGSETAAPTFFDIAKELFLYYGIPPNE